MAPADRTPSPLDQLAGIEQRLRDEAKRATHAGRYAEEGGRGQDYAADCAAEADECSRLAATLATLREGLVGFGFDQMRELLTRVRNGEQPSAVLLSLLTPDSPRQAGEEITDG